MTKLLYAMVLLYSYATTEGAVAESPKASTAELA